MKNSSTLLTGSLFVILFGSWVNAAPLLDQSQPVIDTSVGGLAIGGSSQQKLAQVVTAGISGSLTEVRFPIACDAGDLIIEIQDVTTGKPNGVVLTSETIPGSSLPSFFPTPGVVSFRSFVLSTPVSFSAGSQFAIVLTSPGACGIFRGPVGDSYLGGNSFFDALPNTPGLWVCICDFAGDRFDLPFQTLVVEESTLVVSIDIKTSSFPNSINPQSRGGIPVAILTTDDFDAATVDWSTVKFGANGTEAFAARSALEDVDGDGDTDMVLHFNTQGTGIQCGDTSASLTGVTLGGQPFSGSDSINTVGCHQQLKQKRVKPNARGR